MRDGETIEGAAKRELFEESGIMANMLEKRGVLNFGWEEKQTLLEVHVFLVPKFSGIIAESEEMKPRWWRVEEIPFKKMWPDDTHWMPLFLAGKKFRGTFIFNNSNVIISHKLEEIM